MAKGENRTRSNQVRVALSEQAADLLDQLAKLRLLGKNRAEVAGDLINDAHEVAERSILRPQAQEIGVA